MERSATTMLRIGAWCVSPAAGQISRNGEIARLEARTMRLLVCLAEHAGEVVSIDALLDEVWSGVTVSPDSVYQAVASLRRLLGDDPRQPAYIATVPRLGYRMVATVGPWPVNSAPAGFAPVNPGSDLPIRQNGSSQSSASELVPATAAPAIAPRISASFRWAMGAAMCLAIGVAAWAFLFHGTIGNKNRASSPAIASQPEKSIAVLPFLDLTQGMKEEEFADGMTEELIDKLGKIPGLRVPAPTSSFYFKGKQIPLAEIAKALGVVYVLDGSVRKSGPRVRVAARLVRADNGYVIWTESYDRPFDDILSVQDDIASEVTKALRASIVGQGGSP